MATTVTLTVGDLVDRSLEYLYRAQERPRQTKIITTALTTGSTTMQVAAADEDLIFGTTLLEMGDELVLVTGTSGSAPKTLTIARGYAGTTPAAHAVGDTVLISPSFPRAQLRRRIVDFFTGPANTWLPRLEGATFSTAADGELYLELPTNVVQVLEVRYLSAAAGRLVHIGNWEMHENLPTSVSSTTKMLTVSAAVGSADDLICTYHLPWGFTDVSVGGGAETTDPAEEDTIAFPFGADDLPVLYAAATTITGRELTRLELDNIEEWNATEAIRQGIPVRYIQQLWQQFYRRVDEARRLQHRPKNRPYRKMSRGLL